MHPILTHSPSESGKATGQDQHAYSGHDSMQFLRETGSTFIANQQAVAMLPGLAKELAVSVEELVGVPVRKNKRGPTPKLQQQLERISQLPRAKQHFVIEMLDTVLQQAAQ